MDDNIKQYIDPVALSLFRKVFWDKCKEKGIVLEDLVNRTGLSYIQIYRIVRGTKNTSLSNVIAVIRAAGFQPYEIFTFSITIPDYPPLRCELKNSEGIVEKKTPGAKFFIKAYLENGHFEPNGFTPAEITEAVNVDLDKDFVEKDFSSEFSKMFNGLKDKNPFKRIQEGNTFRYFSLSEEERNKLPNEKRKMRRKKSDIDRRSDDIESLNN